MTQNETADTRTFTLSGRRITQRWDGLCWMTVSDVADNCEDDNDDGED